MSRPPFIHAVALAAVIGLAIAAESRSTSTCAGTGRCAATPVQVQGPSLLHSKSVVRKDPLALVSLQVPPASAAEAVAALRKEADVIAAFRTTSRAAELVEALAEPKARLEPKSEQGSACEDDDACLQNKPYWGSSYTCAGSTKWCTSYESDMACCPVSCGTCPATAPAATVAPILGDKLLFSIPKQAQIYQMGLDGTNVGPFIMSGAPCPHVAGTQLANEAVAMMGRPEFLAVDVASNVMFWNDWLGGTADGDDITYNASVVSSPIDSAEIDPVVTSAFYRPPPGHPDGLPGCDGFSTYTCPPASFHTPAGGDLPISHLDTPTALSVDPVDKMLYWSDRAHQRGENGGPANPKVQRASYDGFTTPPEDFNVDATALTQDGVLGEVLATAIDYREGQRKMYWVEDVSTKTDLSGETLIGAQIRRASLDNGAGVEVLASYLSRIPTGFALDLVNDQFYWTEYVGGRIQRCPLTGCPPGAWDVGSAPELVLETFAGAYSSTTPKLGGIALDPANEMMYWTEDHTSAAPPGETDMIWGGMVKAAKFDGTGVHELYRYTAENSQYSAAPLGISIVTSTPLPTNTATTTTQAAGTAATWSIEVTAGDYPDEISWVLDCDSQTTSGGAPYSGTVSVSLGGDCTLDMRDSYGDGWNSAQWTGLGQTYELNSGTGQKMSFNAPMEVPTTTQAGACQDDDTSSSRWYKSKSCSLLVSRYPRWCDSSDAMRQRCLKSCGQC